MAQINEKLLKRAKFKYISKRVALALMYSNKDSSLFKSYRNTFYCNDILENVDGRVTGTYCKNRWCIVCGRIKTAQLINGYLPQLQILPELHFVTLTLPTVPASLLSDRITTMEREWRRILDSVRRNKSIFLRGLRKMECTLRPDDHYHYHYHIILSGKQNAEWLIYQWLRRFPDASDMAQDVRPADDRSYKELFKYFTKLLVSYNDDFGRTRIITDFKRLDFLFCTLRGKRVFQPFGGLRMVSEDIDDCLNSTEISDEFCGKIFKYVINDWVSEFDEKLTGFQPSDEIKDLLRDCPDVG